MTQALIFLGGLLVGYLMCSLRFGRRIRDLQKRIGTAEEGMCYMIDDLESLRAKRAQAGQQTPKRELLFPRG